MNFTDLQLFEQANLKCLESFTEADAVRRIKNSLDENCKFKYFFIEKEEQ